MNPCVYVDKTVNASVLISIGWFDINSSNRPANAISGLEGAERIVSHSIFATLTVKTTRFYRESLKRDPMDADAWFGLGNVMHSMKRFHAEAFCQIQATTIRPDVAILGRK